jgi:hypothetical protein
MANCQRCGGTRWVCINCQREDTHCECEYGPSGRVSPCPDCWNDQPVDLYVNPHPGGILLKTTDLGVFLIRRGYVPLRVEGRHIEYNGRVAAYGR